MSNGRYGCMAENFATINCFVDVKKEYQKWLILMWILICITVLPVTQIIIITIIIMLLVSTKLQFFRRIHQRPTKVNYEPGHHFCDYLKSIASGKEFSHCAFYGNSLKVGGSKVNVTMPDRVAWQWWMDHSRGCK